MEGERNAYWVLMAKSDRACKGGRSGTVGQKEKPDPSTQLLPPALYEKKTVEYCSVFPCHHFSVPAH